MCYLESTVQADGTAALGALLTCSPSSTPHACYVPQIRLFSFVWQARLLSCFLSPSYPCLKRKQKAVTPHSLYQTTQESCNNRILFQRRIKPLLPSQWVTSVVYLWVAYECRSRWGKFISKGAITARSLQSQLTSLQRNPVLEAPPG